jgi:hypothetical protein
VRGSSIVLRDEMVGLNPSRFYGRLLPRPRIYCDVKFSDARVDPPESVNAAFLEWAGDASWKMGGTAAKRKRMSGKIEGRMSKLRAMDESDEDEEPAVKKVVEKKTLGFGKNESPASVLPKHMTPIERMLETPGTKRGKLAPRRIMSSPGDGESDEDSDDDLEGFMQRIEENKLTPNRRKSARLQGSPSQTPDSKKRTPKSSPERAPFVDPTSLPSPVPHKRKRGDEDSGSESDSPSEDSDSVYL